MESIEEISEDDDIQNDAAEKPAELLLDVDSESRNPVAGNIKNIATEKPAQLLLYVDNKAGSPVAEDIQNDAAEKPAPCFYSSTSSSVGK